MNTKNYSAIASHAQDAVASIQDPELKRVAFEKILDDLLNTSPEEDKKQQKTQAQKATTRKKKSPRGKTQTPKSGPTSYILELISEDFFSHPKSISEIKEALAVRGKHIPLNELSMPLQRLCLKKILRRQRSIGADGKKQAYLYSKW